MFPTLPASYPHSTLACRYDGYRLTYLGYDYLAIKTLVNRGSIAGVGRQVGAADRRGVPARCFHPTPLYCFVVVIHLGVRIGGGRGSEILKLAD